MYTIALIFLSTSINAQLMLGLKTNYGKTIGSSNTIQFGNEYQFLDYEVSYLGTKDVVGIGLTSFYEHGNLWFQSDMLYRKSTSRFLFKDYTERNSTDTHFEETYHILHIPVQAGILWNDFKFGVGPMFNFNLQYDLALDDHEDFEAEMIDLSMGFQFLIGYKINNHLHVDLKFERTFNNIGDHYKYKGSKTSLRVSPNMFSISLASIL